MTSTTRIHEVTRLWTRAQPAVAACIAAVVVDFNTRDDLLQDVAVAVVDSFDEYDTARPFLPWALGVARNRIRMHFRGHARDRHVFNSDVLDAVSQAVAAVSDDETSRLRFLADCVDDLPERSRTLVELRYTRGLLPAAIATTTGQSANTISKSLQRLRERLRECIERRLIISEG